ncbi:MAG: hypothetical protein HYS24_15055 [Ignavibacteriales bacterium]|nr:hypothetical protein [Ignavibacteriales bacterium]
MRKFWENIIKKHTAIEILFNSGIHPEIKLRIIPIFVENDLLFAIDVATNKFQKFPIDKITVENNSTVSKNDNTDILKSKIMSIHDIAKFYHSYRSVFIDQGWLPLYVEIPLSIKLFKFNKSGNLKKSPEIAFYYDEYLFYNKTDIIMQENDSLNFEDIKPYRIFSNLGKGDSYSNLSTAIDKFLILASEH